MIARLRSFWLSVNASYWFYPAIFSLAAFALAVVTTYFDRVGASEWLTRFAWLQPSRPEGARTVLTVIAGSMIGVASTVFSITIAAVAYASGNYGPRLLTNFMEDKGNQLSLGTFIATFVYAAMVLRVVRGEDERPVSALDAAATPLPGFTPQLSLLVATGLALIAVGVLVYFLHHIPDSIRINTVLKGIGRRLIADIRRRYPEENGGDEPDGQVRGTPVAAEDAGYVEIIDFETLDELAETHGLVIALRVRTGDFIHVGKPIVELAGEAEEDIADEVRTCFKLGGMRTRTQDLEFLVDELVEIALRALSPGINDPFTAINAIHWLGAATAEIGRRDLTPGPEQEDYDRKRIQPLPDDFGHFLGRGFGAIRASAATSPLAAFNFLQALATVACACSTADRKRRVLEAGRLLFDQARGTLHGPALEETEARFVEFEADVGERCG